MMGFLSGILGGGGGIPNPISMLTGGGGGSSSSTMNSGGTAGGGNIGGSTGNTSNANNTTRTDTVATDRRQVVNSDAVGISSDNSTINIFTSTTTSTTSTNDAAKTGLNDALSNAQAVFGYQPQSQQQSAVLDKNKLIMIAGGLAALYLIFGGKK